ncbi:MAG: hypothetical protein ACTSQO_00435 [Candidatus Helarchaeota archaeon]
MQIAPDTLQIIGIIELIISSIVSFILVIIAYKKYRQKKVSGTLIYTLIFIFIGLALLSTAADRILLNPDISTMLGSTFLGLIFHNIAVILSLVVLALLDSFAFEMTYPRHVKKLSIVIAIIMGVLAGIILINQPNIDPSGEIIYSNTLTLIILPFLLPVILLPIIIFIYYAISVRKYDLPKSKRAAIMSIGNIIVAISYIFELTGIVGFITIIVRLGFVIYVILMYITFVMPNWFKNLIKWE